jgi:hypothetical protein
MGEESEIHLRKKFSQKCDRILILVRFHGNECTGHKTPLATKSLDNIFARQLSYGAGEQGSPFLWREATRSEEQLYHTTCTFPGTTCLAHKASRFSGARYVEDYVLCIVYI